MSREGNRARRHLTGRYEGRILAVPLITAVVEPVLQAHGGDRSLRPYMGLRSLHRLTKAAPRHDAPHRGHEQEPRRFLGSSHLGCRGGPCEAPLRASDPTNAWAALPWASQPLPRPVHGTMFGKHIRAMRPARRAKRVMTCMPCSLSLRRGLPLPSCCWPLSVTPTACPSK